MARARPCEKSTSKVKRAVIILVLDLEKRNNIKKHVRKLHLGGSLSNEHLRPNARAGRTNVSWCNMLMTLFNLFVPTL